MRLPWFIRIPMLCAVVVTAMVPIGDAQDYPRRPIRMIVGLPPGGSTDIMGRLLAAKLSDRLKVQIVVDNRAGASGIIGADLVAKSQPDGYTLLMAGGSFGTIGNLYAKLPFDTARDFAPIALFALSPYVFVVHPSDYRYIDEGFHRLCEGPPGSDELCGVDAGLSAASQR